MIANPVLNSIIFRSPLFALALLTFTMISRVFTALGAPGIINFLHFGLSVALIGLIAPFLRNRLSRTVLFGLFILLLVTTLSAIFNGAGILNIFLEFLLLSEPFILLALVINVPISQLNIRYFRLFILSLVVLHSLLAYFQFFTTDHPDFVKGFFLGQGTGHHVAGAVALTAAIYFFSTFLEWPLALRLFLTTFIASVVIISDSKQVVAVFLASLGILLVMKGRDFGQFLKYAGISTVALALTFLVMHTLLPSLLAATEIDRLWNGLTIKFTVFPLMASYYDSPLNWLFGLGPGHTVGRLGFLMPDYYEQLTTLGATNSPVTQAAINLRESHRLSRWDGGSSLWSPFFSLAGVWGDLGILGFSFYLSLWFFVFREICSDDLSRFYIFNIILFGVVFGWMEEPGYMLFVVYLIGLNWQEQQARLSHGFENSR